MLHVTPKSATSMYVGMPIQKAFIFELDKQRIKDSSYNQSKVNVFHKMGISNKSIISPVKEFNKSFSDSFWGKKSEERSSKSFSKAELEYQTTDTFAVRSDKFYKRLGMKIISFRDEINTRFKVDLNISNQLEMVLFFMQKWEQTTILNRKVKTIDEEKNFLENEYKGIKKEKKILQAKSKELLVENSTLKNQNELLLEEKNYFINQKTCLDNFQGFNDQQNQGMNLSGSINIGKTKMNSSVLDILNEKNKVSSFFDY